MYICMYKECFKWKSWFLCDLNEPLAVLRKLWMKPMVQSDLCTWFYKKKLSFQLYSKPFILKVKFVNYPITSQNWFYFTFRYISNACNCFMLKQFNLHWRFLKCFCNRAVSLMIITFSSCSPVLWDITSDVSWAVGAMVVYGASLL